MGLRAKLVIWKCVSPAHFCIVLLEHEALWLLRQSVHITGQVVQLKTDIVFNGTLVLYRLSHGKNPISYDY